MSQNNVSHDGIVKEVLEDGLLVEMKVTSACAACHAKSACMAGQGQTRLVKARTDNTEKIAAGDRVRVSMKASLGGKAVLLAYVLPLFILLGMLLLSMKLFDNELIAFGITVAALALYYICLKLFSKKIATEFVFYAEKY